MENFLLPSDQALIKGKILENYTALRAQVGKTYVADLNDQQTMMAEALAYRIALQNASINAAFLDLFLESATGERLDAVVENLFGVTRLPGVKPQAEFTFNLTSRVHPAITIGQDFQLTDGSKVARPLETITIAETTSGQELTAGPYRFELQDYVADSKAETTQITTPRPYIASVTQNTKFAGGAAKETDEALRSRAKLARTLKSTAGTLEAYKFYTLQADNRIRAVDAVNSLDHPIELGTATTKEVLNSPYQIQVYFQTENLEDLSDPNLKTKVKNALLKNDIKPLADKVYVFPAKVENFSISAVLHLEPGSDRAAILEKALTRRAVIEKELTLGQGLTLFQIKKALAVDDKILDVDLKQPTADLSAEIGKLFHLHSFSIA